jgi:hypothetical protein
LPRAGLGRQALYAGFLVVEGLRDRGIRLVTAGRRDAFILVVNEGVGSCPVAALQSIEGPGDCVPPPCGDSCRLSWGCAVLRGLRRTHLGRSLVPPDPSGVRSTLRAFDGCASPPAEAVGRPSLDFHSPSELITGTPHRPAGSPARRTMLTLLGFVDPTTQSRGDRSVLSGDRSLCRRVSTCGVWLPPSRPALPTLPALFTPERPWVSLFKAFPSRTIGTPLGVHALLALPQLRRTHPRACSAGTRPSSGPRSRGESVLSPDPRGIQSSMPS